MRIKPRKKGVELIFCFEQINLFPDAKSDLNTFISAISTIVRGLSRVGESMLICGYDRLMGDEQRDYSFSDPFHCSKQHYESVLSILLLYSFSIRSNVGLDTWSAFANCPLFSSRRMYRVYSKGNSSVMATFLRPL